MIKIFIHIIIFFCLGNTIIFEVKANEVSSESPLKGNSWVDKGWEVFINFHQDLENINRAIALYKKAIEENPQNYRAYTRLARAYRALGDYLYKEEDEKIAAFEQGKTAAQQAIMIKEEDATAHLEYAVCLGKVAQTKGIMKTLFMVPEFKTHIKRALELDPEDKHALAVYGSMFYELPWFLGGDLKEAEKYIKMARERDPNYSYAHLSLAKVYFKKGMYKEAERECLIILEMKNPTYPMDWHLWDLPRAQELLNRIRERR